MGSKYKLTFMYIILEKWLYLHDLCELSLNHIFTWTNVYLSLTHCGLVFPNGISDKSPLVEVMACYLFGTKLLPEPMLTECQLNPETNIIGKI